MATESTSFTWWRIVKSYTIFLVHKIYVIGNSSALVNEKGEEQPLKAGDFAVVMPDEKCQYRNKGDVPFKMICGVSKKSERLSFRIGGCDFFFNGIIDILIQGDAF